MRTIISKPPGKIQNYDPKVREVQRILCSETALGADDYRQSRDQICQSRYDLTSLAIIWDSIICNVPISRNMIEISSQIWFILDDGAKAYIARRFM